MSFKPPKLTKEELAAHLDKLRRERFAKDQKAMRRNIAWLCVHAVLLAALVTYLRYLNGDPGWMLVPVFYGVLIWIYYGSLIHLFFQSKKQSYTYTPPTQPIQAPTEPTPHITKPSPLPWRLVKGLFAVLNKILFGFVVLVMALFFLIMLILGPLEAYSRFGFSWAFFRQTIWVWLIFGITGYFYLARGLHSDAVHRARKNLPERTYKNRYINRFVRFTEFKGYIYLMWLIGAGLVLFYLAIEMGYIKP